MVYEIEKAKIKQLLGADIYDMFKDAKCTKRWRYHIFVHK